MDDSSSSRSPLSKLGIVKYINWEKSMYGRLMYLGVIRIVLRKEKAPPSPTSADPAAVAAHAIALNIFETRSDKAAGEIYQWLDEANKIHVDAIRDDPAAMWEKLRETHSKSAPNSRFNSLSDLFGIRKLDNESLTDLTTRVEGAMLRVKALRPPDTFDASGNVIKGYTLEKLDEELTIMAMIRALPGEFNSFISSVLLLSTLSKDAVLDAFRTEETQRRAMAEDAEAVAIAIAAAAARILKCYICDGEHTMVDCPLYEKVRTFGKEKTTDSGKGGSSNNKSRGRGARGKKAASAKVEEGCDGPAIKADSAVCCSSSHIPNPAAGLKLSKAQCATSPADIEYMRSVPYIQATGALLYLAMCTRPDIAYTVGVLCRFNTNPGPAHWKAVKHLLRYIRGTLDYRIEYSATAAALAPTGSLFQAFSDADHGGNIDNGRSTTGTLLLVAGGAVSWFSRLQSVVALSTTEAEFVAASETGRELCWLRNFLADIGAPQKGPSHMNMDNQSAISVTKHPEHMGRLKHLDRHWFWLRQAVEDGKVAPSFIPTSEMTADILTKSLPRDTVNKFRRRMGLVGEWTRNFDPPQ
ncbi:hypothetical protein D9615_001088 [Tricholomella constricta]|uniref:Polyprotein n=1 Tax=Tricholomella constricta TaxID=117010 RepID=A0A8H5HKT9_9AGAR|nr:hypothetical protein D9615_001088 [Tricholomella constricta]